jgi:S-DNA-T family DNA segregation ATPase FtsK/SpoIIIE
MTVWRVQLDGPGGPRPVHVEGDAESPRGALVEALASVGWPSDEVCVNGARWTRADTDPLELHHGALLSAPGDDAHHDLGPESGQLLGLVVVAGPSAGKFAPVPAVVGRTDGDLLVEDPLMSARHFSVEVGSDVALTLRDVGSRNGTVCDGDLVSGQVVLDGDSVVAAGASLFAVARFGPGDRATLLGSTPTGQIIQRQFREALAELPEPPSAPKPPSEHRDDAGSMWWRALLPIATAGGMALYTGRWWFLAIAALSPIVFGYDALRRARRRRRQTTTDAARYAAERARYEQALTTSRRAEVRRARRLHAGGGAASVLAIRGHRRVWERTSRDGDFGTVTLGHAALPSAFQERGQGDEPALLWKAPLSIDLTAEGPLAVTGPVERTRAVTRALLVDLAVAHAPVDVNVSVFTDAAGADAWAFTQWLPHVFGDAGSARLATTSEGRAVLIQSLRSLMDARREHPGRRDRSGPMLPLHVVVVDGVHTLAPDDLAELLRHGPDVGVVGIVADTEVVPEGVRSEVRLGRHADECSYRSVLTPRVDAVTVAELPAALALEAAVALAPLEAVARPGGGRPVGQVLFTELIGLGARTAADQVDVWRECSPRTNVPVGVTTDGAPFLVDFVRHGPHGLIGGMTRSGKTEFLKTWFASLALHNHPDDLAIAIVDFKGGVDHQALAALPHVIALATNQDIDLFERTLALLAAEQERRQRLFTDVAGVATLEGYRTARSERTELPPVPRLLVVVDEFGELLETPEGRAQLGRLESTARIGAGLGVHLLLLTQLFDHALPATIDAQAGLRMCFKVQQGEHSNVVLKSPAAASIGAHTKGRGFARFQGGDLIEFQAARVGNVAQGGARQPAERRLLARFATLGGLALPRATEDAPEVPNEQQDLHRVVELVRRAAALDGCRGDVVPWPGDLPEALDLADVPAGAIGIADDASHQRAAAITHDLTSDVVMYAGASGSGHHEALVTTALQLARDHPPEALHLYGIDAVGGGLAALAGLPHVGTIATRDDATALRILGHLNAEAVARRGATARHPAVVLFVLGLERLFLHAEGGASPLLAPLTTLVNEVAGTGIQVVCSGSHAMLGNRIGMAAGRRLVFRAHDPVDYPPTVPRSLRARLSVPLRCFDPARGLVAQIARPVPPGGDLAEACAELAATVPVGQARPPRRFIRAPWPLRIEQVTAALPATTGGQLIPLGVRPDTGEVVWLDPIEDGLAHRIVGPPKSGRSNALAAIGVLALACGWDVVCAAASRRSPLPAHSVLAGRAVPVDELPELVGEGLVRPTVVLVDDAHKLDDEYPWRKLTAVESANVVTFVAGATEALARTLGVMRTLNAPGGVALMPARPRDADAVGVRLIDDDWLVQPLPGIGVAGICGEAHRIQFPQVW